VIRRVGSNRYVDDRGKRRSKADWQRSVKARRRQQEIKEAKKRRSEQARRGAETRKRNQKARELAKQKTKKKGKDALRRFLEGVLDRFSGTISKRALSRLREDYEQAR
jgi:hypothetical protein